MHQFPRKLAAGAVFASVLFVGGCETLGYYSQAISGQLHLLAQREPVADVLREIGARGEPSASDATLRGQLLLSQRLLEFAKSRLQLDPGNRYRTYVALEAPAVVWNLFAAPSLSLEAETWCYPFVGCAPYRGYFDRSRAVAFREKLAGRGFDTYLGEVAAYSTLGWFDDPLLSTFLSWPEANLARLLFHELAHSRVWLKGNVAFNESFASFVGGEGMAQWLAGENKAADYSAYLDRRRDWQRLLVLLEAARDALRELYQAGLPEAAKLAAKQRLLDETRACYHSNREALGGGRYDRLMQELNNAFLVSLATYSEHEGAFAALFSDSDQRWAVFYAAVEDLARSPESERDAQLVRLGEKQIQHAGNDERADDVQCESFTGHGFNREMAGAEHDDIRRSRDG